MVSLSISLPPIPSPSSQAPAEPPRNAAVQAAPVSLPQQSVQPAHEAERHSSVALDAFAQYTAIARHHINHDAPMIVRNVPIYVIQGIAQMAEHSQSEHQFRDATIGVISENAVEVALTRFLGATTPAGIAMLTAYAAEQLQEALPPREEVARSSLSDDPHAHLAAGLVEQARLALDLYALPRTAVHVISRLASNGFERLSNMFSPSSQPVSSLPSSSVGAGPISSPISSQSSSSISSVSSSSISSYSSSNSPAMALDPLPQVDEVITVGRLGENHVWEIVRIKIIEMLDGFSPLVPSGLSEVASSAISSASSLSPTSSPSPSALVPADSADRQAEGDVKEDFEVEGSNVQWSGLQFHVPLENLKNTRISTGVSFGQNGQVQTGVSTTLRHPIKDLQVSAAVQVTDFVAIGASTSLRQPLKDGRVGVSVGGFGASTSWRHPKKSVVVSIPVTPLIGFQIPLRKISQARIAIGVPLIPGLSVSVPVKKIEKAVKTVVRHPVKAVGKPIEKAARTVGRIFGRKKKHK